jgi:hypothetical protein
MPCRLVFRCTGGASVRLGWLRRPIVAGLARERMFR